ncbi:DUF1707 domain-containing protein [Hoyosella rhizosphaerae]|uniref:DUF1707 domain-containing protein n=1 Tax=Hoyosella rhizosphaerae TaxID=1755582 RepID=A0A916U7H9_9ACTN|nr:DUF1707 domain-containing protein [Hoyosella rhizosphaerae]MBN4927664.1 DUF1707 domain-containing protein [Hoyosella rhizosphaerae]GGC62667.1 hypothetical protein GCM10011410_13870 [Hoyosella rhizosphaerae]
MDEKDLRVSDAEREHIAQLLQRAVGLGLISIAEFGDRMDQAMAARTRGDLNAVVADLPGMQVNPELAPGYSEARMPARTSGAPLVLKDRFGDLTRKGQWHVPTEVTVKTLCSSAKLDFTHAIVDGPVVYVTVDDTMSSITLIVNENTTVDLNGVETFASSVSSKVQTGPPPGHLHIVVRGKLRFGTLKAKYSLRNTWKKMLGS